MRRLKGSAKRSSMLRMMSDGPNLVLVQNKIAFLFFSALLAALILVERCRWV